MIRPSSWHLVCSPSRGQGKYDPDRKFLSGGRFPVDDRMRHGGAPPDTERYQLMRWKLFSGLTAALGLALLAVPIPAQTDAPDREQTPEGIEVQARGPVHEAYAEPSAPRPEAAPV